MIIPDKKAIENCVFPSDFFNAIIEANGGLRRAAIEIELSPSFLSMLASGKRTIGRLNAERLEALTDGEIRKEWLLWGNP